MFLFDQAQKALGASYVGALTHINKQAALVGGEGLKAGQSQRFRARRYFPRGILGHSFGNGLNVLRARTTAATDNVEETVASETFDDVGHFFGRLIIFAQFVRQTGVGVCAYIGVSFVGQFFYVRTQGIRTQSAVQSNRDGPGMGDRIPEGFGSLAGQGTA